MLILYEINNYFINKARLFHLMVIFLVKSNSLKEMFKRK